MRTQLTHTFNELISLDNLLVAWQEFSKGKRNKSDVQLFSRHLAERLNLLHESLSSKRYKHGGYYAFSITDPKPRDIHKATVEDRVLHHAVYRLLYPFFDNVFIHDSYSCRIGKGTHKALEQFKIFSQTVSKNNTRTCWVLKCDVKKFFASIDQHILLYILSTYTPQQDILWLIQRIVLSFHSVKGGKGLPLGNLTSQLLVNVYMNEFDQYAKHVLKAKFYIRYADDFVLLSEDKDWLTEQIPLINHFLWSVLRLSLHPDKVFIKTLASGVDFLGWVHFPTHRVLRTSTARRMQRRVWENPKRETVQSYLGLLQHGNAKKLSKEIISNYLLLKETED
ncbi:MAG: reverse transcriptase/maturase family protein [Candidatus Andersenbacteria bacterium]